MTFHCESFAELLLSSQTPAAPSGPPRDILVISRDRGSIRVSWLAPDLKLCNGQISKYEVVYREKGGSDHSVFTEKMSKDITGLKENRRYEVAVRAHTKIGGGPLSRYYTHFTGMEN